MQLRNIPPSFPVATVASIDARLDDICAVECVKIPLAIESGSRAWGFPSPDSDFDCRFVFVRPAEQHLSPWLRRDVIETPLIGDLDVNGWDLAKALKLLLKAMQSSSSGCVRQSSIAASHGFETVYCTSQCASQTVISSRSITCTSVNASDAFTLLTGLMCLRRRSFFALRPAATLRWLRHHPEAAIAPMHFPTLMAECAPPTDLATLVANLIERKSITRELGSEPLPPAIAAFIDQEFDLARQTFEARPGRAPDEARQEAEQLYRAFVLRAGA